MIVDHGAISFAKSSGVRYFVPKRSAKYCDEHVHLSVCPFAYLEKTTLRVTVVVAQSSSASVANCATLGYVFPVLWMTSCLYMMDPMARHV